ncbi:sphingomyelinase C-like [Saccoglossus kowalevskii]
MLSLTTLILLAFISTTLADVECNDILVNTTRPSVWIDDAPDCHATATYCEHFSLEYVCSADILNSDNPTCKNGTKVLCIAPPAIIYDDPKPVNELTVIAYNIYEINYVFEQHGQRESSCRNFFHVLDTTPDLDVIIFNEVFMGGCFPEELDLLELLNYHGFIHNTATVGLDSCQFVDPPKVENGGVFISSRWPILYEEELVYESFTDVDGTFFCKGAMYAKIEKTIDDESQLYHIFGTHMQAYTGEENDKVRVEQAAELYNFMTTFNIPDDEPVIYGGDFNADSLANIQNAIDVLDELHATMPPNIGELQWTLDRIGNDFRRDNTSYRSWLDYVVFSYEHAIPEEATVEVLRHRDEWYDVCMQAWPRRYVYPWADECKDVWTVGDLSDHYAVRGVIQYSREIPETSKACVNFISTCTLMVVILSQLF